MKTIANLEAQAGLLAQHIIEFRSMSFDTIVRRGLTCEWKQIRTQYDRVLRDLEIARNQ